MGGAWKLSVDSMESGGWTFQNFSVPGEEVGGGVKRKQWGFVLLSITIFLETLQHLRPKETSLNKESRLFKFYFSKR